MSNQNEIAQLFAGNRAPPLQKGGEELLRLVSGTVSGACLGGYASFRLNLFPEIMRPVDCSGITVVLFGHGTTRNEDSGAAVYQQAAALRREQRFGQVREAFWKQEPRLAELLGELRSDIVCLVPLFLSEGYFSEEVIPKELGFSMTGPESVSRVVVRGGQRLLYCRPVGTHTSMTEVLLARAREVLAQFPFPRAPKPRDVTLFIAAHGTERSEKSRQAAEQHAERIRGRQLYAAVHAVFLEEEPRIASCQALAQTKNVVMVPFFLGDGLHVREDIPVLLGEPERLVQQRLHSGQPTWRNPTEKKGKLVWYTPAAGTDPLLREVIMNRVTEALAW